MATIIETSQKPARLVEASELIKLFSPQPTERTILTWRKARIIPFIKMPGKRGKVYFDVDEVFRHLKAHNEVTSRDPAKKGGAK